MKLRLYNKFSTRPHNRFTTDCPFESPDEVIDDTISEYWILEEVDNQGKAIETGFYMESNSKGLLLAVLEKMRHSSVEEFYEL